MTIGCNIWMFCLKLNRFFYGLSRMLHISEFVWILRSSVLVVFNNFLLIDATDGSKIRSDQKRFFIALSLYPLSFFSNTPFKQRCVLKGGLGPRASPWAPRRGGRPPPQGNLWYEIKASRDERHNENRIE